MNSLTIEIKHTGERLTLRRIKNASGIEELHLSGTLPPHRQGPPLHIHFEEEEYGDVISGTLSALLDGKKISVDAGKVSLHRRLIWTGTFKHFFK